MTRNGAPAEFTGRTVEEAIAAGLQTLGVARDAVEAAVLDEGARGFLGIGARPARVRLNVQASGATAVQAMTAEILRRMGIEATVLAEHRGEAIRVTVSAGQSDGLLIGRKGETLHALEHVLARMAGRTLRLPERTAIEVDIAGYRGRRAEQLEKLARELAERVERTGRRAMTEPLAADERRVMHRALGDNPRIEAHAAGTGPLRRIVITPPRAARRSATR